MKFGEFLGRFVYTRKCPSCNELIPYELSHEAFCNECRAKWDKEKVRECDVCGRVMCECSCMTRTLAQSGALCHKKIVNYSSKVAVVHNTLIFIKKNNNTRVSRFLAVQLSSVLSADEDISEMISSDCVVCYVPRSRSAVLKYGHDQSQLLAQALSEELGCTFIPALRRSKRSSRAQKKLSADKRAKNVRNMFETEPELSAEIKGKRVVLVDDIVTTGASMGACARVLIRAGAVAVICASVASTKSTGRH